MITKTMFQFHNGTIKTEKKNSKTYKRYVFQFHNGTIKTARMRFIRFSSLSFNSITVQLRPIKYSKKTSNNKQVIQ